LASVVLAATGTNVSAERSVGLSAEIENMHDCVPEGLRSIGLMHRHGLNERGHAAMPGFDNLPKLID
jgi:hypothetical protein